MDETKRILRSIGQEKLTAIFCSIDTDNSGSISKLELFRAIEHGILQELEYVFPDHVKADDGSLDVLQNVFAQIDTDGDGFLCLHELLQYCELEVIYTHSPILFYLSDIYTILKSICYYALTNDIVGVKRRLIAGCNINAQDTV